MANSKTLSTGVLVKDPASFNAHIDIVNIDANLTQTVIVEILDLGVDQVWNQPTPLQLLPSGPVTIPPHTHQSFIALITESTVQPTRALALYEIRVTIPDVPNLVVNCFAKDVNGKIIDGNTVLHEELVGGGNGMTECCAKSIAELRALQPGAVPCLVVLGYYAPGDGGGSEFYWDAVATESDNGGTIIVPLSNPPAGRWKRVVEGAMSVRWFGAKGDGVTPDEGAIEAAITATAFTAISGEVFMPPGEYAISTTVTVTSPVNNITITGSGAATKLLPKSRDFVALSASGLDEFHIRKLWIMAAVCDTSGRGVTLVNCTNRLDIRERL
jgi:hypothetical protein